METASVKLYSLSYKEIRTYLMATLFIAGNIILPQLFHFVPNGGRIWLPIYFFTLIGTYKYGWRVGLLTAIFSPLINSLLFSMPMPAALPAITVKSVLLASAAGYAAYRFNRISIAIMLMVVLSYQVVGSLAEWAMIGDFTAAMQDFRLGVPGMLLQAFGGYLFIKYLLRK